MARGAGRDSSKLSKSAKQAVDTSKLSKSMSPNQAAKQAFVSALAEIKGVRQCVRSDMSNEASALKITKIVAEYEAAIAEAFAAGATWDIWEDGAFSPDEEDTSDEEDFLAPPPWWPKNVNLSEAFFKAERKVNPTFQTIKFCKG